MPKIVASDYQGLNDYSGDGNTREKGLFQSVFICGKPRQTQKPGFMYCTKPDKTIDTAKSAEDYLIYQQEKVYVILMFLRRVRAKYEKVPGRDYDQLTYFCWNPNNKDEVYPEGAKIEWIFAGALFDENKKPVMDVEDPTRIAFVYFRNKGVKCGNAFNYINLLEKKTEELEPLSDDPNFEKTVVTPRRFMTEVSVDTYQHAEYGGMYVFKYDLAVQLPDETCLDIIEKSKKWTDAFDNQFDVTQYASTSGRGGGSQVADSSQDTGNPKFDEQTDEQKVDTSVAEDFTLPGI